VGIFKSIDECHFVSALDYVSGTATRYGAILDMAGFAGVIMIVKFAAIAASAVVGVKAQSDTAVGGGTMADLLASGMVPAADDDNQIFVIDLYQPVKRYVRVAVTKDAANACAEDAIYMQYGAQQRPTTVTVADLVTYKRLMSPIDGTA
jgi:hypothetical protein